MKKILFIAFVFSDICIASLLNICTFVYGNQSSLDFFSLRATATWREYPFNIPQINFHKEKWAWACSLTFKSKEPVKLSSLILQWKGEKLSNLAAALYQKKEREAAVIPIQQNLVCEGIWNKSMQQLVFRPNEKVVAVNKYYLMVSFPKEVEKKIKKGKFIVLGTQLCQINPTYSHIAIHQYK